MEQKIISLFEQCVAETSSSGSVPDLWTFLMKNTKYLALCWCRNSNILTFDDRQGKWFMPQREMATKQKATCLTS
jgi:hypothetical protein